jgi:hypothetical protein
MNATTIFNAIENAKADGSARGIDHVRHWIDGDKVRFHSELNGQVLGSGYFRVVKDVDGKQMIFAYHDANHLDERSKRSLYPDLKTMMRFHYLGGDVHSWLEVDKYRVPDWKEPEEQDAEILKEARETD